MTKRGAHAKADAALDKFKREHDLERVGEDTAGFLYWCRDCGGLLSAPVDEPVSLQQPRLFFTEYEGTGERCSK